MERNFHNFPNFQPKKLKLVTVLASIILDVSPAVDATVIPNNPFTIKEVELPLPTAWFAFENSSTFENSLIVFSVPEMAGLVAYLSNRSTTKEVPPLLTSLRASKVSARLLLQLTDLIQRSPGLPASTACLLKNHNSCAKQACVSSFVKLLMVANGQPWHPIAQYPAKPALLDPDAFHVEHDYSQFGDILPVLSEYNSRQDLLMKFLTLYHVIESFSVRFPLAKLQRDTKGKMPSMRELGRNLGDKPENAILADFFKGVFPATLPSGDTFKSCAESHWQSLSPATTHAGILAKLTARLKAVLVKLGLLPPPLPAAPPTPPELEELFRRASIEKPRAGFSGAFSSGSAAENFSKLLYAIRNAIVHNKANEWHLSNAALDPGTKAVIENFLLPCLQELCFDLLSKQNDFVWYDDPSFSLYG
jgi:hypothetical protein